MKINLLTADVSFNMIPVLTVVFYAVFIALTLINVYFGFTENEKYRKITKPFCLLSLLVGTIIWFPNCPFLYIALIFDLIGDILLIWKRKLKIFILGTVSFFLGHIFFMIQALSIYGELISWSAYLIICFILLLFNILAYPLARKVTMNGNLGFVGDIYVSALVFVLFVFGAALFVGDFPYMLISVLGMSAFITSDGIIIYTKFIKKIKRQEFFIMSLYLIGQFMIVLGFCLTFASI